MRQGHRAAVAALPAPTFLGRRTGAKSGLDQKTNRTKPELNTYSYLKDIYKVDVIAIYGISDITALELLAEKGTDISKWPSAKHFVSWLNLNTNNKISGETHQQLDNSYISYRQAVMSTF